MNRDGSAERLIWRQIPRPISCTMTCAGATNAKRLLDSMPPDEERNGEDPAGGGFTPREDGGNPQHPVHDEDQEDASSAHYEREIDRLDAAIRDRLR